MLTFEAQPILGAALILEKLTVKSPPSLCPFLPVGKAPFLTFARFCWESGVYAADALERMVVSVRVLGYIESSLPESRASGYDAGCAADEWRRASRLGHRLPTCRLTLLFLHPFCRLDCLFDCFDLVTPALPC